MSDPDPLVCCKLCGRVGRSKGMRTGYQDGTWLCLVRRSCNRRIRQRRAGGMPWRGLNKKQADAMATLFWRGSLTAWEAEHFGINVRTLNSLVSWRLATATRLVRGDPAHTVWHSTGAWWN